MIYSAINAGQMKNMATQAYHEMNEKLTDGAGPAVSNLINNLSTSNNFQAVNLGQLKTIAKPFYDRFGEIDGQTNYPWTGIETNINNNSAVNSGQVKNAFKFPLDYKIQKLQVGNITEHRFYHKDHNFMTLVDDNGTLNLRPHPGNDVNGWGSSIYMQPFLPGATLKHTTIEEIISGPNGIKIKAKGSVSRWAASTYGSWDLNLALNYNLKEKKITGNGNYSIDLEGLLSGSTGDLNLFKIASNYLDNVPLLSGGTEDTGDMKHAIVIGDGINFTWNPSLQPGHFPYDITDNLSINVIEQYNEVDTVAQG